MAAPGQTSTSAPVPFGDHEPGTFPAPPLWALGDKHAAMAVMDAYIKPGTDRVPWFKGIRPWITDQFATELGKIDQPI